MMKIINMRNILFFGLYFVLSLKGVYGESENEIKRGIYMFMVSGTDLGTSPHGVKLPLQFLSSAFHLKLDKFLGTEMERLITFLLAQTPSKLELEVAFNLFNEASVVKAVVYYPDASIVGPSGTRFSRSAVLIRSDWLISSSLENNDTQLAFPQKTLVARVGAISIDCNFTFNEDEGEQEREIIEIVRPTNFNVSQWWNNDITLLKALLPFTMSSTVASTTLSVKRDYTDKTSCYVLIFAKKYENSTDNKLLMQLAVELLPSSNDNCGLHFRKETMICASNSDENKNIVYEPDFCYTNGGGPLLCEGDVIGLQSYVGNCKQPYLYQLLLAWDDFITCGVEDKCRDQCANICVSIDKDYEVITFRTNEIITIPTSEPTKDFIMEQSTEESNDEDHLILSDTTIQKIKIVNDNETPTPTTITTVKVTTTTETTPPATTEMEEKATTITEDLETSWPKEKNLGHRKKLDDFESSENIERTTKVEAQLHGAIKERRNAAESYVNGVIGMIHGLAFELLFFICIV